MTFFSIPVRPEDEWRDHARCHVEKVDPRLFDGVQKSKFGPIDYSEAKAFCGACPVRLFCLEDAITRDETECVRGGLEPDEYRLLKPDTRKREIALKSPVGLSTRVSRPRRKLVAA